MGVLPLGLASLAGLMAVSLIAGIGITALGPGGVLATIALWAFTSLSPAQIAGTAIVTHIGTGILGSFAYVRSGQLREPQTRKMALVLAATAAFNPLFPGRSPSLLEFRNWLVFWLDGRLHAAFPHAD